MLQQKTENCRCLFGNSSILYIMNTTVKLPNLPLPWINQEIFSIEKAALSLRSVYGCSQRNSAPAQGYLDDIEKLLIILSKREEFLQALKNTKDNVAI